MNKSYLLGKYPNYSLHKSTDSFVVFNHVLKNQTVIFSDLFNYIKSKTMQFCYMHIERLIFEANINQNYFYRVCLLTNSCNIKKIYLNSESYDVYMSYENKDKVVYMSLLNDHDTPIYFKLYRKMNTRIPRDYFLRQVKNQNINSIIKNYLIYICI